MRSRAFLRAPPTPPSAPTPTPTPTPSFIFTASLSGQYGSILTLILTILILLTAYIAIAALIGKPISDFESALLLTDRAIRTAITIGLGARINVLVGTSGPTSSPTTAATTTAAPPFFAPSTGMR